MKKPYTRKILFPKNPINELIENDTYNSLLSLELLNQTYIRNYLIRKEYKELRANDKPAIVKPILERKYNLGKNTLKHILEKKFFAQDYCKNQSFKRKLKMVI